MPALASAMSRGSRLILTIWKNNHGARVLFMGGIRPGGCSPSSEHPCGKALDACKLRRGAVDLRCKSPGAPRSLRLLLRMACSKAAAGAIPTTATRRLA